MTDTGSKPRIRTKFERSLFLGFLLVAVTLGAVSIGSLAMTGRQLGALFERLWSQSGTDAGSRDLAFFARRYLEDLTASATTAVGRAMRECCIGPVDARLDCVFARLTSPALKPTMLTVQRLELYRRQNDSWAAVAGRPDVAVGSQAGSASPDTSSRVPDELLDRFHTAGAQPEQRRVGVVQCFSSWEEAGEPGVLVITATTDSAVAERWGRALAQVERPSFGPFISQLVRRQSAWVLIAVVLVTLLGVIVSRVLAVRVSHPLSVLMGAMGEVSRGNLSYRAPHLAQEEFGFLADSFNSMTENIERLNHETRETARIRRELEMAREIQLRLFPQELPRIEGFDLFAANQPSLEVSGDYYDVLPWGKDGAVALVLADVSGKGVPAALVMSNIQACLHSQALRPAESLCDWMSALNRQLFASMRPGTFVTLFFAVIAASQRSLVYINAGHNPPLLLRAGHQPQTLETGGLIVGALPQAEYDQGEVVLQPGDLLVMYTDGVTEARSPGDEEFGEERFGRLLNEVRELPAEAIGRRIFEEVRRYTGLESQADDVTLVVLKSLPTT